MEFSWNSLGLSDLRLMGYAAPVMILLIDTPTTL